MRDLSLTGIIYSIKAFNIAVEITSCALTGVQQSGLLGSHLGA